jgi:uncharacterized protein
MNFNEIKNQEGEKIDYAFHAGSRVDALIIFGHGVTGNKDRPHLIAIAEGLAEIGWPCLRVSFSGNGESEGHFQDSCITKEISDLQSVFDVVPHDLNIIYVGHSMGGAVGVLTAARDLRIKVLVSLSGMAHTADFIQREFSDVTPDAGLMWEEENCPLSQAYVDDLRFIHDTLSAAEAVTQPWLLIHGDADEIIPIQDSCDAFKVAICERKKLIEIPNAEHSFDDTSYAKIIQAIDEWLSESL